MSEPLRHHLDPAQSARLPGDRSGGGLAPLLLNVEDFAPARFLRTRVLRDAGYDVVEASSAGEALQLFQLRPPAVALIDVNLPDSSGIVLCDTLKRMRPELTVLLISAVTLSDAAHQAGMAAGATAYLGEPVASDTLVRSVRQALDDHERPPSCDVWVVTDAQGTILDASQQGARLLSATVRGLMRRSLIVFFEHDRDHWHGAMTRASAGERVTLSGRLRPKERRPVAVRVAIERAPELSPPVLLWSFRLEPAA
jgi:CheY-like chemotaxis protein